MKAFATVVSLAVFAWLTHTAYTGIRLSLDRSHQKRTMSDMRTIGTALEARAAELKSFSMASPPTSAFNADAFSFGAMRRIALIDVQRALSPKYLRTVPTHDDWGYPFEVRIGFYDAQGRAQRYAIRSMGSDGKAQGQTYTHAEITKFSDDIIFGDGSFYRYPEGI